VNVLVAGFGNIFRSDDGLGCAVAALLAQEGMDDGVRVRDFGTGGMHLALEMLGGYDRVIIVDAVALSDAPGTVFAVDVSGEQPPDEPADPHDMRVSAILALYERLRAQSGAERCRELFVIGCVPDSLDAGMELSDAVRAALPACAELVRRFACKPRTFTGVQS
jgi:hydrogenase maturation protease